MATTTRRKNAQTTQTQPALVPEIVTETEGLQAPIMEPPKQETARQKSPASDTSGGRFSVPLTPDGKFDFSQMRESSKAKLMAAINSSGIAASAQEPAERMTLSPAECKGLYGALGSFEALIVTRFYGVPPEIAGRIFTYDDADMELLAPPTSAVMSKHASDWMVKYKDEFSLLFALLVVHQRKLVTLRFMMAQQAQAEKEEREIKERNDRLKHTAPPVAEVHLGGMAETTEGGGI